MEDGIKLRHVLVAIVICGIIISLGYSQVIKEKNEFEKAKEKLGQTLDILLDTFEKTIEEMESEPNIVEPEPNIPVEEWKIVIMDVSAYCPCEICCENFADGITASGHKIQKGDVFVAAPSKYSFGTEMIIPEYANGEIVKVLDMGGAIKGDRLDLFFHTHKEAIEWGRKKRHPVKVRV